MQPPIAVFPTATRHSYAKAGRPRPGPLVRAAGMGLNRFVCLHQVFDSPMRLSQISLVLLVAWSTPFPHLPDRPGGAAWVGAGQVYLTCSTRRPLPPSEAAELFSRPRQHALLGWTTWSVPGCDCQVPRLQDQKCCCQHDCPSSKWPQRWRCRSATARTSGNNSPDHVRFALGDTQVHAYVQWNPNQTEGKTPGVVR